LGVLGMLLKVGVGAGLFIFIGGGLFAGAGGGAKLGSELVAGTA
jgi:hypothetical protein